MKTRSVLLSLAVATLSSSIPFPLSAEMVQLSPVADTSLFEPSPDNNLGGQTFLAVGVTSAGAKTRALLRFGVADALPAGATINSATLELSVSLAHGLGSTFNLHRMLVPWQEGAGSGQLGGGLLGSLAVAGEVTWSNRVAPSTAWGQAGAKSGDDYVSTPSASAVMSATALDYSSSGLAADVQRWLNNPATNHGWIIIHSTEATLTSASRVNSRETTSMPLLTIDYTPPVSATPPNLFGVTASGNNLRFAFNGQAGKSYTVENRTNLIAIWTTLTNIPPLAASTVVSITNSISGSQRFYRVRTP